MLDSDPDVVTASLSLFVAHFTLLKNNNRCRLLYQECDDWRRIFLTDDCEIFDEKNFGRHIAHLSATGEIKVERKQIVEEDLRYFWSGRPRYIILWYRGRLLDPLSLRQPGYFHFIKTKYKPEFRVETDPDAEAFYITNQGIYPLHAATDYLRFVPVFCSTALTTIPWYVKQTLKFLLLKPLRSLRKKTEHGNAV